MLCASLGIRDWSGFSGTPGSGIGFRIFHKWKESISLQPRRFSTTLLHVSCWLT